MKLVRFVLKNIRGTAFRSVAVTLCALVVAGFAFSTTVIIRGAQRSLQLAVERLGADMVIVPEGTATRMESALLMGVPVGAWMPEESLRKTAAMPGVAAASAQTYLATLHDLPFCSAPEVHLVAFDPATDFTITPWLQDRPGCELRRGEVIAGSLVSAPEQRIMLYDRPLVLVGSLRPTGTGLDQTLFFTAGTAQDVLQTLQAQGIPLPEIPAHGVSSILVKMAPNVDLQAMALRILRDVPGATPLISPDLFQAFRRQMNGLLRAMLTVLTTTWVLSVVLIGLIFSMAANERRRELGVLRALGATRRFVLGSLLAEAGFLSLIGGSAGIALGILVLYLFGNPITSSLKVPFLLPPPLSLLALVAGGLALATVSVIVAALFPALRISRQDPAIAMRE